MFRTYLFCFVSHNKSLFVFHIDRIHSFFSLSMPVEYHLDFFSLYLGQYMVKILREEVGVLLTKWKVAYRMKLGKGVGGIGFVVCLKTKGLQ